MSVIPLLSAVVAPSAGPIDANVSRTSRSAEFWEDHFKCRYPGAPRTPYNAQWRRACSGRERLRAADVEFEGQLQFVADAVLAFVVALR